MAEREGQQFGNYRLVRLLGKGGFAEVYLGVHLYLGTQAALKLLHTQLASAGEVEKFRVEARTVATLVHPHIVRVLDFGVQEGTPFLVMDYAPNGSLRQMFPPGKPIAPALLALSVRQVAEALQYAHDQRLIHRDVKPENMLLGRNNEVLLTDFGIATVSQTSSQQSTQAIAGTAAYMAPEQLQGHPRPASDQYALGVAVYEWLSGERPFHGSFTEIASQHILVPPPPLRAKLPMLSPAVEQVVLTALAKDPKERFGSMRAFATAFEQASQGDASLASFSTQPQPAPPVNPPAGAEPSILSAPTIQTPPRGEAPGWTGPAGALASPLPPAPAVGAAVWAAPVQAPVATPPNAGWAGAPSSPPDEAATFATGVASPVRPPGGAPTSPPRSGVSRRAVLVAGVGGLALIGGGAALLVVTQQSGKGTHHGPTPTPSKTVAPDPSASPSASATATNTATATAVASPTLYTYHGHAGEVDAVVWSPTSQRVASASFDRTVQVWDALTGANALTYRGHSDQVWTLAWSPDGKYIASAGKDKTVQVWDPTNLNQLTNYTGHSAEVEGVAWSPDSQKIASASYDNTVRVWVALTQQFIQTYMGHSAHVWTVAWSPDGKSIASAGKDTMVQVWDASSGNPLYQYTRHTGGVAGVAWSPDGKRIASASYDHTVQLWDALTGAHMLTYRGHSDYVTAVAWSPDGKRLVSSSRDGTAQVWDAGSLATLMTYRKHQGSVDDAVWSPDGRSIVSAGADQTVQVWSSS